MTTNVYLDFARRWYWLIALGIVVAIVATWAALSRQVPLYQSTATIQVGRTIDDKNPDQNSIAISDRLVPSYAELAKRDPVLDAVVTQLALPYTADGLRARLLVSPVPATQLIDIKVVDADPAAAAAIANAIASQVILQSPDTAPQDETQAFIQEQLVDLQGKIRNGQQQILELQNQIALLTSAADVFDAQTRLDTLQAQVDAWQESYATLVASAEPSTTNIVRIVSAATPAAFPQPTSPLMYYMLAVVVGAGLASLLALGLTLLFEAVSNAEELRRLVGSVPVVTVPHARTIQRDMLVSVTEPGSSPAAAYRVLRNILQTDQIGDEPICIAVVSSRPGEGKTTLIANLGVVLANAGHRVILVDANLRNPMLDTVFGLSGPGFVDVMLGEYLLEHAIRPTALPNLAVLGAGSSAENYADVLSSGRLRMVLGAVTAHADIVLVDTPGIQEEQEALLLAQQATAVIVVVEAGRIRAREVRSVLDALRHAGVRAASMAFNKAREPRFGLDRLPWSRETRLRRLAEQRRANREPAPVTRHASIETTAD